MWKLRTWKYKETHTHTQRERERERGGGEKRENTREKKIILHFYKISQ